MIKGKNEKKISLHDSGDGGELNVFDRSFLSELNLYSCQITDKNDFVNEIFLYFIIPLHEKIRILDTSPNVKLEKRYNSSWFEAHRRRNLKQPYRVWLFLCFKSIFDMIFSIVMITLYMLMLPIYILFRFKKGGEDDNDFIAVIRSSASFSKMKYLEEEGVSFYFDSITFRKPPLGQSIYSVSLFIRLKGVFVTPFYVIRDFSSVFLTANRHLGFFVATDVLRFYQKRIVHKAMFEFYLTHLILFKNPEIYFTGNKEDRFAVLEGRLCKKNQIKSICIPHGLEYAFKMPMGLVGDVFYCNTKYAKESLEELYSDYTTKFLFEKNVIKKMLFRGRIATEQKKVVFFPELREPDKNLVIIKFLKELNLDFFLKLHPKDSLNNYSSYVKESQLITDFDDAISNSICLARKSTVLLESIYNHSISIAVLIDDKDRSYFDFMFPSLSDEKILKTDSFIELGKLLESLEVKHV